MHSKKATKRSKPKSATSRPRVTTATAFKRHGFAREQVGGGSAPSLFAYVWKDPGSDGEVWVTDNHAEGVPRSMSQAVAAHFASQGVVFRTLSFTSSTSFLRAFDHR